MTEASVPNNVLDSGEFVCPSDPFRIGARLRLRGSSISALTLCSSEHAASLHAYCRANGLSRRVVRLTNGRQHAVIVSGYPTLTTAIGTVMAALGRRPGVWSLVSPVEPCMAQRAFVQLAFAYVLRERRSSVLGIPVEGPGPLMDREPESASELGLIIFPHLMVASLNGSLVDRIVWEAMKPDTFYRLTGRASFDLARWRDRLGILTSIKRVLREGRGRERWPSELRRLEETLRGRYLSFRFALEREEIVDAAIRAAEAMQLKGDGCFRFMPMNVEQEGPVERHGN